MNTMEHEVSESQIYGPGKWKILMAESGLNMFLMRVLCLVLNFLTLFIAVPWTTTMYYNAWARNVEIDGKNLKFTGNAVSFFGTWLKTLVFSVLTLGFYYLIIGRKNIARWVDSNLQWSR